MKERIKMIVVALFSLFGAVVAFALVHEYLPSWVYYSCIGVFLIWFLYDVSKPGESKKHYWLYHSIVKDEQRIEVGVLENESDKFSFTNKEFDIKKSLIFSAVEIDKETFDIIFQAINQNKEDRNE